MSVMDVVTDLIGSQHTRGTPLVPATRGEIRCLSSEELTWKMIVEGRKFIIFTSSFQSTQNTYWHAIMDYIRHIRQPRGNPFLQAKE